MTAKREFLSTNEVAQTLGISPFTIRRYIRLRKLKAVKLEGSYRVRRAALKEFLTAREVETEEEFIAMDRKEKRFSSARKLKHVAAKRPAKKSQRTQGPVRKSPAASLNGKKK